MPDNFKQLKIWQESKRLPVEVYKITKKFPKEEAFGITNQVRRASVSVPANIAESSGRWHEADKIQLLMIARGSLAETQSHLAIAMEIGYLQKGGYDKLDKDYELLGRSLNAFIKSLRTSAANAQSSPRRLTVQPSS